MALIKIPTHRDDAHKPPETWRTVINPEHFVCAATDTPTFHFTHDITIEIPEWDARLKAIELIDAELRRMEAVSILRADAMDALDSQRLQALAALRGEPK